MYVFIIRRLCCNSKGRGFFSAHLTPNDTISMYLCVCGGGGDYSIQKTPWLIGRVYLKGGGGGGGGEMMHTCTTNTHIHTHTHTHTCTINIHTHTHTHIRRHECTKDARISSHTACYSLHNPPTKSTLHTIPCSAKNTFHESRTSGSKLPPYPLTSQEHQDIRYPPPTPHQSRTPRHTLPPYPLTWHTLPPW